MLTTFEGKTAVITGAANGLGLEFSRECARRKMKLVMNDIEPDELERALKEIRAMGAVATGCVGDVSLHEEVHKLVRCAVDTYGTLDLMFNNAGVFFLGKVWETPVRDVQWMFDINTLSVCYGMMEAIPVMQKQGTPCHIVNSASIAGQIVGRMLSTYHATKAAVVALSEATYMDLQSTEDNKVGITVFCPGYLNTDLSNCERHRPARFATDGDPYYESDIYKKNAIMRDKFISMGEDVDSAALNVFKAIEEGQFYVRTDTTDQMFTPVIELRCDNIMNKRNPK